MTASGPAVVHTCPLHNGNPPHADAAPRFAVSAPKSTVTKARTRSAAEPGRKLGVEPAEIASNVASNSIAVPRCRMTVHAGNASFTVSAPSRIGTTSRPNATREALLTPGAAAGNIQP